MPAARLAGTHLIACMHRARARSINTNMLTNIQPPRAQGRAYVDFEDYGLCVSTCALTIDRGVSTIGAIFGDVRKHGGCPSSVRVRACQLSSCS